MKPPEDDTPTYAELGIEKRDAHQWQKIAATMPKTASRKPQDKRK